MISGLLAILLTIAALAFIFGGPSAAGRVMASPFQLFGWVLRGLLGAAGRGASGAVRDAHRYGMRHHPRTTLKVYGWIAAVVAGAVILLFLAGCSSLKPDTVRWGTVQTEGHLTPRDAIVPKQELVSGFSFSWGRGGATSFPAGTVSGYQVSPDGKVSRRHEQFGGGR